MQDEIINLTVPPELSGQRADKIILKIEKIASRAQAQKLFADDCVLISGKSIKGSAKLNEGQTLEVRLKTQVQSVGIRPLDSAIEILFEDSDLIVLNKASGIVVHPAVGHQEDTLVNMLVHHTKDLSMGNHEERPGIVHRLDKETSGLLVVAKNNFAHEHLSKQFQARTIHRLYEAVCWGEVKTPKDRIESVLARHPKDRKKFASLPYSLQKSSSNKRTLNLNKIPEHGKIAITNLVHIATAKNLSLVELKLETGRTHQIRVHLSEIGHPILGDNIYGAHRFLSRLKDTVWMEELKSFDRFFLHAHSLGFNHPRSEEFLSFKKDWPEAEKELIQKIFYEKT